MSGNSRTGNGETKDLEAETLSAPSLQVNAAGMTASVEGTKILKAMNLRGTVKLEPVVLHEVHPRH